MLIKYFSQQKFGLDPFKPSQIITLVVAFLVVSISLTFHELWLDELEAPNRIYAYNWNVSLLINSFRGDGHFPLYHLLIYPFLFIGNHLLGIGVELIIKSVTFIQYVILSLITISWVRFPFSFLFLLSYYPLFEYGTISRCYLLGLILLLVVFRSILLKNKMNQYLTIFACFLFPITDSICFIYSIPLLTYCIIRKHWLKVSAFVASYPIAIFFLLPSSSHSYSFASKEYVSPLQFIQTFIRFVSSAWIPFTTDSRWWNQSLAVKPEVVNILFAILIILLVCITFIRLYAFDPLLLLICCLSSGLVIAALVLKYPLGAFRHIGFATWPFLCLLVLLYSISDPRIITNLNSLSWFNSAQLPLNRLTYIAFTTILSLQCFFGLAAVYKDVKGIFAFPAAQAQVLHQLREKAKHPDRLVFLNYPASTAFDIEALSNWQFNIEPVWSLANRGCTPTGKGESSLQANPACPRNIVIVTWGVPLQGLKSKQTKSSHLTERPIQENLLETFSGQSVGSFLEERSYQCRKMVRFTGGQTVDEYTYRCRRKAE